MATTKTKTKAKTPTTPQATDDRADIRLKVGGDTVEIRFAEFTALEARAFREATGQSIVDVIRTVGSRQLPDIDILAGLVWLVRQRTNSMLEYEDVAGQVTYQDLADSVDTHRELLEGKPADGAVDEHDPS
jgi:hypothetical protein